MYLFLFKQFAGHDRVFHTNLSIGKPGDLLQCGTDFLLNLGDEISFPELIRTQFSMSESVEVVYPGFFDQTFLNLVHWMVYQWYTTYNNVMKLFVSFEIPQLLAREGKIKGSTKKMDLNGVSLPLNEDNQNLVIIPDNRSRKNQLSDFFESDKITNLYSTDTQTRKDQHRREIKKSKVGIIVATQSEIFQPFHNLGKIVYVDGYKWYYHNQQDPRYDVSEVVKKMGELWGCEIVKVDNIGIIK